MIAAMQLTEVGFFEPMPPKRPAQWEPIRVQRPQEGRFRRILRELWTAPEESERVIPKLRNWPR